MVFNSDASASILLEVSDECERLTSKRMSVSTVVENVHKGLVK